LENEEIEQSRCTVAKDTELVVLKKREDILKADNKKLKEEIDR